MKKFKFYKVSSTNDTAWNLMLDHTTTPFVVIASKQQNGRGRYGRMWESEEGGLYMSFAEKNRQNGELIVVSTLAVCRLLSLHGFEPQIMLPNDIYVNGKKIAGILIERRGDYTVLGVGLNVNQTLFSAGMHVSPTSMLIESGKAFDIDILSQELIAEYVKSNFIEDFSVWKAIVMKGNMRMKVFTASSVSTHTLVDINKDMDLIFKDKEINLFDITRLIKI